MLRRYAKPLVVWSFVSVAAFAQQPNNRPLQNQQPGARQAGSQQTAAQQPAAQQPVAQQRPTQQYAPQQQPAQQQPASQQPASQQPAQQPGMQEPVQRTASTNGVGNVPMDRQAMEQQLAQQQAALAIQLAKMPFEALNAPQQDYLDKVLDAWEKSTAKIERFQANFKRYVFDPAQNAGNDPAAKGEGVVRFMKPDKGLFRVDKMEFFNGRDEKQSAIYRENEKQKFGEYWLCDGKYVHIIERNAKNCLKVELPPYMRGQQIHLSPLPFLFGVKADEIKSRYWVRPIAPPAGSKDVVLETFPKRPDDAGNYSRVQIFLDSTEVLPKALVVFLPNWRPEQPHREIYEFVNRDKDWTVLDQLKDRFKEEFIPQTLPKDWKVDVQNYLPEQDAAAQQVGPPAANPQQQQLQQQQQPQQQLGQPQMRQAQTPGAAQARPNQPAANQPLR